jgi:hypothetical protein
MKKTLVTLVLATALTPALAMAQKTSYDYDKTANFAALKTYAQKDGTKVGQPLIDDRIVAAIDAQMAAKGFTKSDSNPDAVVVYHIAFDKEKDISTFSSGYGGGYGGYGYRYGGGWGGGTTSTQVRDILIGTLVIDIADTKAGGKGQIVWRGMGVKEIDTQAKPEKRDKNISSAVEKIFKNYPPKVKS